MTGMAAVPGKDLPLEVVSKMVSHFIFSQLAHNGNIVFLYSFSLSILFSPFFVLLYYIYSYLSVFLVGFSLNFHFFFDSVSRFFLLILLYFYLSLLSSAVSLLLS